MNTQKNLRIFILAAAAVFLAYKSWADTITLSTFYPSPYGSYQNLDTTGETHLATAGGNVGIGTTNPAGTSANAKTLMVSSAEGQASAYMRLIQALTQALIHQDILFSMVHRKKVV